MKLVGVSQRIDFISDRNEIRDCIDHRLINFLAKVGLIAVPIPNSLITSKKSLRLSNNALKKWIEIVQPSGFILSGGNDINQYFLRDQTEKWILDYAYSFKLPLLGICRGMQMISYWAGVNSHLVKGHVKIQHTISGLYNGKVNSYHNYSIDKCPKNFKVLARSKDGEIEAIRHIKLPWEGWMWHPERNKKFSISDITKIKKLFK